MADILINKFRTTIPRVGATPATPGFAESEGQDPVAPSGSPLVYTPVTIGTPANGLSIDASQVLTIGLASASATGALSSTDWNTFNNKLNLTSPITGYTVGANTALADTDTILQAFGKVQAQINNRLISTATNTQVLFSTGSNTAAGDAGLTWDNSGKILTSITNANATHTIIARNSNTGNSSRSGFTGTSDVSGFNLVANSSTYSGTQGFANGVALFTGLSSSGGLSLLSRNSTTGIITFHTGGDTERIRISNGGQLWIGTTSGTNTLDVNGTARIRTISNLGTAATSVLVPSATGVLSFRTLAELASDGLGSKWTDMTGGIFRNGAVAVGRTTIPTNATFAVQSLTATGTHQFFQLLNNAGTVLASLTQNGDLGINTAPVTDIKLSLRAPSDTATGAAIRAFNLSNTLTFELTGATLRSLVRTGINRSEVDVSLGVQPLSGESIAIRIYTNAGSRTVDIVGSTGNYQSVGGAFFGISNTTAPTGRVDIRGIGTTTNSTLLLEDSAGTDNAIFLDNGQIRFLRLPTSSAGLAAGSLWNNGGVLNIV